LPFLYCDCTAKKLVDVIVRCKQPLALSVVEGEESQSVEFCHSKLDLESIPLLKAVDSSFRWNDNFQTLYTEHIALLFRLKSVAKSAWLAASRSGYIFVSSACGFGLKLSQFA